MIEKSTGFEAAPTNFATRIVIVTGMSGAGKTLALRILEDIGFNAVDNIAPELLPIVVDYAAQSGIERLAVVTDARSGYGYSQLLRVLADLRQRYGKVCLLFLDSTDDVLVRRFKETRRPHPLYSPGDGVLVSIAAERTLLAESRDAADRTIDTSSLTVPELRSVMDDAFADSSTENRLIVTIESFGFKYGLPLDADVILDVRFLRNPYWAPELRHLDGADDKVREYVAHDPNTGPLLAKFFDLLDFSLPQYQRDGKAYLTVAIGCTGGQHRSVVISEMLAEMVRDKGGRVLVRHRDVAAAKLRDSAL